MKTLAIPSSGIVVADAGLSTDLLILRSGSFFRRSRRFIRPGFLHLASARQRNIHSTVCLSSQSQVSIETADNESQEICQSKTVHVKFQIQKECAFGDELLLVGDDPVFGLWDPENGIPLTWSEGHVWVVEMDMPVRKTIQFKFILKASTGTITWQSGPDRTFQSWETNNTITICEDWEDAEQQRLIEDDGYPSSDKNEACTANSEVLVVAEKVTYPKEKPVSETSNRSSIANNSSYPAEKCLLGTPEEPRSILSQEFKPMAIVADNIGNPKKDSVVNAGNEFLDDGSSGRAKKKSVAIPNKDAVGKNKRVAAVNNRSTDVGESQITCEGGPVLVPGLTSFSSMVETEEAVQFEGEKSGSVGVADGPIDAKNSTVPELEKKQELDGDACQEETTETFINEEDHAIFERRPLLAKEEDVAINEEDYVIFERRPLLAKEEDVAINEEDHVIFERRPLLAKEDVANEEEHQDVLKQWPLSVVEEPAYSVPNSNEVIVNDIQWGRRAIQKLLASLGLR